MEEMLWMSLLAGVAIPVGGILASVERIRPDWLESEVRHSIIAFASGALLSAVALVLIPDGTSKLSIIESVIAFIAGGAFFYLLKRTLSRSTSSVSQLIAMLSDYIPEVIALGATVASGGPGLVIAVIIALQNLPEGFNAYRELKENGMCKKRILFWFSVAALLGPAFGGLGYWFLSGHDTVLGYLSVFAAAGILYLVIDDVAPDAKLENADAPALGAVLGFLLGMIGYLMER
ncbi:ZIP family metal transporter [Crateriforma conspicua]|uniref:ZIP family metal transporter n=1 Tax=Crateriforma conspicua TaxID=2527996 RepID=UPI00118C8B34|nr:divalent cation transporter [Crateriforma conspicua]QDV63538.1 zinc transporter ZupT [Crateriforma conspicua]